MRAVPLVLASLRAGARNPAVLILLTAAFFDQIAGNPVHSILLMGTGGALAVSTARDREAPVPPEAGRAGGRFERTRAALLGTPRWWLLTGAAIFALVVGRFGRYSSSG